MVAIRNPIPRLDPTTLIPRQTTPDPARWMARALCVGRWEEFDRRDVPDEEAAALCAGCPVIEQCKQLAQEVELMPMMVEGVRAGMSRRARIIEHLPESIPATCKHGNPLDPRDELTSKLNVDGVFSCRGCTPLSAARLKGRVAA